MTSNPADVTQAMTEAYISWQPPTAADVSDPTRAMGLVRASFFNGYNAGLKEQADEIERLRAALLDITYSEHTSCRLRAKIALGMKG